ncbi:uncharacterized protein FIBRA_00422 [Fibroporia radiculosa]|uniref:Uncharacterized protein n=1 Tax=Fibroporia radiculosa TaxID=599839 RepID=J4GHR0_9APHY|nr:uncharacterized protein FIBRA_00422 [Fibroporia radiculosa]CCL98425.1 predicted protein [Fibroporia radiculosa]
MPSCSNCLLYKIDCAYAEGRKKSGPRKGFKRRRVQEEDEGDFEQSWGPSASEVTTRAAELQGAGDLGGVPFSSPVASSSLASVVFATTSESSPLLSTSSSGSLPLDIEISDQHPLQQPEPSYAHGAEPFPSSLAEDALSFLSNDISAFPPGASDSTLPDNGLDSMLNQNTIAVVHALIPLFPLSFLTQNIVTLHNTENSNVHTIFFLHALESLVTVSTSPSLANTGDGTYYTAAQESSMVAHIAAVSHPSAVEDAMWTASGLIYLCLRETLVEGWSQNASMWLRLTIDVVEAMRPSTGMQRGVRRWFARAVWLLNKALIGSGNQSAIPGTRIPFSAGGVPEMGCIRDKAPLAVLELDEFQREHCAFVDLCLDMEDLLRAAENKRTEAILTAGLYDDLDIPDVYALASVPLCDRARLWAKSSTFTDESLLQVGSNPASQDPTLRLRQAFARVLSLIFWAMAVKFDHTDRHRCGMRKTSLYVAVTRIVDAADWIVTNRQAWLWSFAEPALFLARDFLLDLSGHVVGPFPSLISPTGPPVCDAGMIRPPHETCRALTSNDLSLLSLIHDVLRNALASFEPTGMRSVVMTHSIQNISDVLRREGLLR